MTLVGVNNEQEEAIRAFIAFNDWDIEIEMGDTNIQHILEVPVSGDSSGSPDQVRDAALDNNIQEDVQEGQPIDMLHDGDQPTCPHCFLIPCVTTHRQGWLLEQKPPRPSNNKIRKKMYKKFWSVMEYRGAWRHPMYIRKKTVALRGQPDQNMVWETAVGNHIREIMPDCILKFVRGLYPNPPGVPYMGHRWE